MRVSKSPENMKKIVMTAVKIIIAEAEELLEHSYDLAQIKYGRTGEWNVVRYVSDFRRYLDKSPLKFITDVFNIKVIGRLWTFQDD